MTTSDSSRRESMSSEAAAKPAQIVADVVHRGRRRVRLLAVLSLVLWVIAGTGILVLHFGFMTFILPKISHLLGNPSAGNREHSRVLAAVLNDIGSPIVVASVGAMVLAAACTLWVVFLSRRITLREVQIGLADVAEQLRQIQKAQDRQAHG